MTRKLQGLYKGNVGSIVGNIYLNPDRKPAKKKKIIEVRPGTLKDDYSDLLHGSIENGYFAVTEEDRINRIKELRKEEIKIHGKQTSIKEGFVYLVINSAYPGWVKAGMTIDFEDRLSTYNLYSPNKDFQMLSTKWVTDRRMFETILLEELEKVSFIRKGEWFKIDEALALKIFNS